MMPSRRSGLPPCSRVDKVVVEYSARKDNPSNTFINHLDKGEKDIITITTARKLLIEKMDMGGETAIAKAKQSRQHLLLQDDGITSGGTVTRIDDKRFLKGFVTKYSKTFCLKGFVALNSYVYHRNKQIIKTRFTKWKYLSFEHSYRLKSVVFHTWRGHISRVVFLRLSGAVFLRKIRPHIPLYRRNKFKDAWRLWQQYIYLQRGRTKQRLLVNLWRFYTNQSRAEGIEKFTAIKSKHSFLLVKSCYHFWKLFLRRQKALSKVIRNEMLQKRRAVVCLANSILCNVTGSYSKSRLEDPNLSSFPLDSSSSSRGRDVVATPLRYKHHEACTCVTCLRIKSSAANRSSAAKSPAGYRGRGGGSASTPYDPRSPAIRRGSGRGSGSGSKQVASPTSVKHPMTPDRQMSTPSRTPLVKKSPKGDRDNEEDDYDDCENDIVINTEGRNGRRGAIRIKKPRVGASVLEKFRYRIELANAAREGLRVVDL